MSCGCAGGGRPLFVGRGLFRCGLCGEDCTAVRPQGPEGLQGPPGVTPAFEIGTVDSGGNPSVTIDAVSPTLYRLNFILPEAYTAGDNTWTGSNTFYGDVIVSGSILYANGGLNTAFLVVTGGATFTGGAIIGGTLILTGTSTLVVSGTSTFVGDVSIEGPVDISGDLTVDGDVVITGDVSFDLPTIGSGHSRGVLVLDECDVLKYLTGTGSFTPITQNDNTSHVLNPGDPETQVANPVVVSIPLFACAPAAEVQYVDFMVRIGITTTIFDSGYWALNLWADAIGGGGTLLDTCEVGQGAQIAFLNALSVPITPDVSRVFYITAAQGTTPPVFAAAVQGVKAWVT